MPSYNEDLINVQEWFQCNKLSLNVLKTHYMVFNPRIDWWYLCNNSWCSHREGLCYSIFRSSDRLTHRILYKFTVVSLYDSFAYPYLIYCHHVWGKLPFRSWKNISNTKKNCSNYNLLSISSPRSPYILQIKFWMFVTSVTTSLVLSCMNVYMATFLTYSQTIFKEMLFYVIIIFEMQMIYMYHMDALIRKFNIKVTGRNCGFVSPYLLKTHNQFTSLRKMWGTT